MVTSTSSSLACYLLPDRAHSSTCSSSWCRTRRSCMSLVQPPTLARVVCGVWIALVSRGQTKLHPDCVHFSCSLPDCVYFSCCFPTASSSAAAARVHLLVVTHTQYNIIIISLLQISSLCMLLKIIFVRWVGVLSSNKGRFAKTCSENEGWVYFRGWAYFREAAVHIIYNVYACMCNRNENPITVTALRNDYGFGYEYTKQHC